MTVKDAMLNGLREEVLRAWPLREGCTVITRWQNGMILVTLGAPWRGAEHVLDEDAEVTFSLGVERDLDLDRDLIVARVGRERWGRFFNVPA